MDEHQIIQRERNTVSTELASKMPRTGHNQELAHRIMQLLSDDHCTIRQAKQILSYCISAIELTPMQYDGVLRVYERYVAYSHSENSNEGSSGASSGTTESTKPI